MKGVKRMMRGMIKVLIAIIVVGVGISVLWVVCGDDSRSFNRAQKEYREVVDRWMWEKRRFNGMKVRVREGDRAFRWTSVKRGGLRRYSVKKDRGSGMGGRESIKGILRMLDSVREGSQ